MDEQCGMVYVCVYVLDKVFYEFLVGYLFVDVEQFEKDIREWFEFILCLEDWFVVVQEW